MATLITAEYVRQLVDSMLYDPRIDNWILDYVAGAMVTSDEDEATMEVDPDFLNALGCDIRFLAKALIKRGFIVEFPSRNWGASFGTSAGVGNEITIKLPPGDE